jgi:hypothetical protein
MSAWRFLSLWGKDGFSNAAAPRRAALIRHLNTNSEARQ